jgi:uncharacterized protein YdcH (DUF465 family)
MDERATKEYLIKNNPHFRELVTEHRQFDQKLTELTEKPFLTTAEQIEQTVLKKKKLALKDQMQMLIYQFQNEKTVN